MKNKSKKHFRFIAIGLLVMSIGTLLNFYVAINIDFLDFEKGVGVGIILGSVFLLVEEQKYSNQN